MTRAIRGGALPILVPAWTASQRVCGPQDAARDPPPGWFSVPGSQAVQYVPVTGCCARRRETTYGVFP